MLIPFPGLDWTDTEFCIQVKMVLRKNLKNEFRPGPELIYHHKIILWSPSTAETISALN